MYSVLYIFNRNVQKLNTFLYIFSEIFFWEFFGNFLGCKVDVSEM